MSEQRLPTCVCIIPFFNEGERIYTVLEKITKVKAIDRIICVDDGSADTTYQEITKHFPQVTVLRNEVNQGKSGAIKTALENVTEDYVFLIDADLSHVVGEEIEQAINSIKRDPQVDMIVMRRFADPWFSKLFRGEILTTGERVLRTSNLKKIFINHPKSYQIEYAVNYFHMDGHKKVYWMPFSGENLPKVKKMGFFTGMKKEITMHVNCLKYKGPGKYVQSFLFFCRNQYPRGK